MNVTKRTAQEIVGANLRRIRQDRDLSQSELAERSGASLRVIAGIENCHGSAPTLTTLEKVAQGLRVPLGNLFAEPLGD